MKKDLAAALLLLLLVPRLVCATEVVLLDNTDSTGFANVATAFHHVDGETVCDDSTNGCDQVNCIDALDATRRPSTPITSQGLRSFSTSTRTPTF